MDYSNASTEVLYIQDDGSNRKSNEYRLDLWHEVKKRWLVIGVLISVACAVLGPHYGAPGGVLHTEYLGYIPLSYIYYAAGSRASPAWSRLCPLSVAHSMLVVPALCVVTVAAFGDAGMDSRVVQGVLRAAVSAPCAWLALALAGSARAPAALAACGGAHALAAPALAAVACDCLALPPPSCLLYLLAAVPPFTIGYLRRAAPAPRAPQLAALLLLYVECCERLVEAGPVAVGDLLVTLMLVLCWSCLCVGSTHVYIRAGWLCAPDARALALVAVPRSVGYGWDSSCLHAGLSRLPSVFVAPTQALLLAACCQEGQETSGLP